MFYLFGNLILTPALVFLFVQSVYFQNSSNNTSMQYLLISGLEPVSQKVMVNISMIPGMRVSYSVNLECDQ